MRRRNFFASVFVLPTLVMGRNTTGRSVIKKETPVWWNVGKPPTGEWVWASFKDGTVKLIKIGEHKWNRGVISFEYDGLYTFIRKSKDKFVERITHWMHIPRPISPVFSKPTNLPGSYVIDVNRRCVEDGVEWHCPAKAPVNKPVWIVHAIDCVNLGLLWTDNKWSNPVFECYCVTHWTPLPKKPSPPVVI